MKKPLLILWRGLPGSGKSTLAERTGAPVFEADQFFMIDGEYVFNPKMLGKAHQTCRENVYQAMKIKEEVINVANTFTQKWEMKDYLDMANQHGYNVLVHSVRGSWGSVHSVPQEAIDRMRNRWEEYPGEKLIDNKKM